MNATPARPQGGSQQAALPDQNAGIPLVYARDFSFYAHSHGGSAGAMHSESEVNPGYAACSGRILLITSEPVLATHVPTLLCRRRACAAAREAS